MELGVEKASKKVRGRQSHICFNLSPRLPLLSLSLLSSGVCAVASQMEPGTRLANTENHCFFVRFDAEQDAFPTPFRPSHPAKSGGMATLNKFPKVRTYSSLTTSSCICMCECVRLSMTLLRNWARVEALISTSCAIVFHHLQPDMLDTISIWRIRWTQSSSPSRRPSCRSFDSCRCVVSLQTYVHLARFLQHRHDTQCLPAMIASFPNTSIGDRLAPPSPVSPILFYV